MISCSCVFGATNILTRNLSFSTWARKFPFRIKPYRQSSAIDFTNFSTSRFPLNQRSESTSLAEKCVNNFPRSVQPYLRLMRIDKPIGNYYLYTCKIIWMFYILKSVGSTHFRFAYIKLSMMMLFFRYLVIILALRLECSSCNSSWLTPRPNFTSSTIRRLVHHERCGVHNK